MRVSRKEKGRVNRAAAASAGELVGHATKGLPPDERLGALTAVTALVYDKVRGK